MAARKTKEKIEEVKPAEHILISHVSVHGDWIEIVIYFDHYDRFMHFLETGKIEETAPLTGQVYSRIVNAKTEEQTVPESLLVFEAFTSVDYLRIVSSITKNYIKILDSSIYISDFITFLPEDLQEQLKNYVEEKYQEKIN